MASDPTKLIGLLRREKEMDLKRQWTTNHLGAKVHKSHVAE
jgi:hypothetical protein